MLARSSGKAASASGASSLARSSQLPGAARNGVAWRTTPTGTGKRMCRVYAGERMHTQEVICLEQLKGNQKPLGARRCCSVPRVIVAARSAVPALFLALSWPLLPLRCTGRWSKAWLGRRCRTGRGWLSPTRSTFGTPSSQAGYVALAPWPYAHSRPALHPAPAACQTRGVVWGVV